MKNLIEKLANKELIFGCVVRKPNSDIYFIVLKNWKNHYDTHFLSIWSERFGEETWTMEWEGLEILGHPIYIGDVLEKLNWPNSQLTHWIARRDILLNLWQPCGLSKSLQEIAECGYEEVGRCECGLRENPDDTPKHMAAHLASCKGETEPGERLKNPNARALADFIKTII